MSEYQNVKASSIRYKICGQILDAVLPSTCKIEYKQTSRIAASFQAVNDKLYIHEVEKL